jgi:cobalt-zinc-cadmium efflux system membrane fusion protein
MNLDVNRTAASPRLAHKSPIFQHDQLSARIMSTLPKNTICFLLALLFVSFASAVTAQHDDHDDHDHGTHAEAPSAHDDDGHEGDDHGGAEHAEDEHADEVVLSAEAIRMFGLTTRRAERRQLTETITVPARVSYNTEAMAHVGTQVQGRVSEIPARLGDRVSRGDLLLVIDSPELGKAQTEFLQQNATLDAARINAEAAEALADVARTSFVQAEKLRESNSISISDFLERQGALRTAEADVNKALSELRVAESRRQAAENHLHIYGYRHADCAALLEHGEIDTHYKVYAPIGGIVIEREVTPGEIVEPSDEALMVLANMDELWVLGDVSERHVGRVAVGTHAHVTMTALDGVEFEGTVSYVAPHLDPRTRTASVRIVVPMATHVTSLAPHAGEHDPHEHEGHDEHAEESQVDEHHGDHDDDEHGEHHDHEDVAPSALKKESLMSSTRLQLSPGMFGRAELSMGGNEAATVLAVPESAIQTVEGAQSVFVPVPGEPNTFALRPVQVGPRVGQYVPILSGLSEGDEFVATGTFILKAELGKEGAEHAHAH